MDNEQIDEYKEMLQILFAGEVEFLDGVDQQVRTFVGSFSSVLEVNSLIVQ